MSPELFIIYKNENDHCVHLLIDEIFSNDTTRNKAAKIQKLNLLL